MRWVWNASERRLRAGARLAIFGVGVALIWVAAGLSMRWVGWTRETLTSAFVGETIGVSLVTAAAVHWLDRRPLSALGLALDRRWALELVAGTALGAGLVVGVALLEAATGLASYVALDGAALSARAWSVLSSVVVFVCVAWIEELVFRGYVLANLIDGIAGTRVSRRRATVLALSLSSLAFGAVHAGNPHVSWIAILVIVLAGFFLAAPRLWSGELGGSIGLHLGWNLAQSMLDMPVSGQRLFEDAACVARGEAGEDLVTGGAFGPEAGATGLVAVLVGSLLAVGLGVSRRVPGRASALGLAPRFEREEVTERSFGAGDAHSPSEESSGSG